MPAYGSCFEEIHNPSIIEVAFATPTAAHRLRAHKPFFAFRALISSLSNSLLLGAYFRYHQHHPSLINT